MNMQVIASDYSYADAADAASETSSRKFTNIIVGIAVLAMSFFVFTTVVNILVYVGLICLLSEITVVTLKYISRCRRRM